MVSGVIAQNYARVLERIERAARRAGRDPAEVRLVVITKTHPVEAIREALAAGAGCLGESYAQEAVPKILALSEEAQNVEWHMVGHVQSRKARLVSQHFDYLHSLDRLKIAQALSRIGEDRPGPLPVLLECNVSGEGSKFGFPAWEEQAWPALLNVAAEIVDLPNIEVRGLMTMAPWLPDPEQTRPIFRRLRSLRDFLERHLSRARWEQLSMGMSADFEAAILEGATFIRVGTAIMGERPA